MLKNVLFILLLLPITLFASSKECEVKPNYDIVISKESVRLSNKQNDLIISPKGAIVLNGKSVPIGPKLQEENIMFQQNMRNQLPQLEQKAYTLLGEVKIKFEQAIKTKSGNESELHNELNKLYKRLVKLLHRSINTENSETHFYYKNFNNIKKEGEEIGQEIFYNIIGNSLLKFNFFKNYDAIKKIAKNEWRLQKPKLKAFDAQLCQVITNIDSQYNDLMDDLK